MNTLTPPNHPIVLPRLISIDPSSSVSSWALFPGTKIPLIYGQIFHKNVLAAVAWNDLFFLHKPELVLIEDQYLGFNPQALIKLVEARSTIQTVCDLLGVQYRKVPAQTWQTAVLSRGFYTAKRAARKQMSCIVASQRLKTTITDDGLADAICIGLWWMDQVKAGKNGVGLANEHA